MVPLLAAVVVLALLGALAFALFGGNRPVDGRAVSPSVSRSPSDSPSASPTSTPSLPPDSVDVAVEALETVVADGVAAGRISSHAADEIRKAIDESLEKFSEGDTEKALEELEHLEEKVDEFLEKEEIHQSQEQRIDRAIEDLATQMELANPPED
jgi:ribosomal protein S20